MTNYSKVADAKAQSDRVGAKETRTKKAKLEAQVLHLRVVDDNG